MQKILVLGAGLSSSYLIKYLLENANQYRWQVTVADASQKQANEKTGTNPAGKGIQLDASNGEQRSLLVSQHDLVISMLPASMHILVANDCLKHKKHLVTASYLSEEMKSLDAATKQAGVLFLNECGLDPGIDHLSAMKLIHEIQAKGGVITSFKSFCGGLVAPEFDDNPWNYKFTWNPRNVVLAGQATAKYLENTTLKFIPPAHIFEQTEAVSIAGYGEFESYANRDSLGYIEPYGIRSAQTVLRGTLRKRGYSEAWNMLVKLGLTDDSFVIHDTNNLTLRTFLNAFVPGTEVTQLEQRVCIFLGIGIASELFMKLKWLGLFEETPIQFEHASPAQILQSVLQQKWKLNAGELDMIVMKHQIKFEIRNPKSENKNEEFETESELVVKGEDEVYTAMAKTVGLPMAIAAKLILLGKITSRGVQIPLAPEFYLPILEEMSLYGISFNEHTKPYVG